MNLTRSLSLLGGKNSQGLSLQSHREFAQSQFNDLINGFNNNQNTRLKRCCSARDCKSQSKRLSATQRYPQVQIPKIPLAFLKNPIIRSGPQFSFGKQRRQLKFREVNTPGPAAYLQEQKSIIYRQQPSYAMRAKIKDILVQKEINSVPGVGNYSFGSSLIKVGTVFGRAKRESNQPVKKNATISSATYNYQEVFKRLKSADPAYSIPHTKKLLITESISQDKMRKTPGPGAYQITIDKGQSYSFGNKLPGYFDMYCKPRKIVPGPCSYEVDKKANEGKRAQSYVFGTQEKFEKIIPSPGPGDYNIGRNYPSKITLSLE